MKQFGKKLLLFVIGNLIVEGIVCAVTNMMEGKDILGNEPDPKKTRVDRKGTIFLGTDDYEVE